MNGFATVLRVVIFFPFFNKYAIILLYDCFLCVLISVCAKWCLYDGLGDSWFHPIGKKKLLRPVAEFLKFGRAL